MFMPQSNRPLSLRCRHLRPPWELLEDPPLFLILLILCIFYPFAATQARVFVFVFIFFVTKLVPCRIMPQFVQLPLACKISIDLGEGSVASIHIVPESFIGAGASDAIEDIIRP